MNSQSHDKQESNRRTGTEPTAEHLNGLHPLAVLARRRWQLLACMLLVCCITFAVVLLHKDQYEAVAQVQVPTNSSRATGGMAALMGGAQNDHFSTMCQLIQSRHVLACTAEKLNLSGDSWAYSDKGIKQLRKNLKVRPVAGSSLIDIVGIAPTAAQAAAIANQITASFIEVATKSRRAANERMVERMNERINQYNTEIATQQELLRQFREEHLITGIDTSLVVVERRIAQLETELTRVRMQRLSLETQRAQLEEMSASGRGLREDEATLPAIDADSTVNLFRQNISRFRQEEAQLAQVYLPGHQKLLSLRNQIANSENLLVERKQQLMRTLHSQIIEKYAATVKQEASVTALMNQEKTIGVALTDRHQRYRELLADLEMTQRFKVECASRARALSLEEKISEAPVVIVDSAHVPDKPAGLSKGHRAASILILGLLFSVTYIFALERFATRPMGTGYGQQMQLYPNMPAAAVPAGYWPGIAWPVAATAEPPGSQPAGQPAGQPASQPAPFAQGHDYITAQQNDAVKQNDGDLTDVDESYDLGHESDPWQVIGRLDKIALGGVSSDDLAFKARCQLVHSDPGSPEAIAFRQISTKLLSQFRQIPQSFVVTGVESQGGKTTCACNLAFLLAQAGRQVLLVDANPQSPALERVFGDHHDRPGFCELLAEPQKLVQTLNKTEVEKLTVLHWGSFSDPMPRHIESGLDALHTEFQQRFAWVIYDAASLDQQFTEKLLQTVGKTLCVTVDDQSVEKSTLIGQIEHCGAVNLGIIENPTITAEGVSQSAEFSSG